MRENRTCGSEGGEGKPFPTPIGQRAPVDVIRHAGMEDAMALVVMMETQKAIIAVPARHA